MKTSVSLSALLLLGVAPSPMPIGSTGVVVVASHPCSATAQSLQRELAAVAAGDDEEAAQLFRAAGGVTLKAGWRVKTIAFGGPEHKYTRLKLLSGPKAGASCWLLTADTLRALQRP